MQVFTQNQNLTLALQPYKANKKIGFVPTMGALHQGHLSLVQQALQENDCVVVSIFVNPTQFDNEGDLIKYPRTLHKDVALLQTLQGTIFVFAPEAIELYNGNIRSKKFNFGPIANEMEGKHRTGHFDGVGTVVSLLFNAVKPNYAYFGEKDFQQLQIVKKLVEITNISVVIKGCAIVREANGLAMSSRNKRLSKTAFQEATIINKCLHLVAENFDKKSIPELNKMVAEIFKTSTLNLEYFEIANQKTLKTVKRKRKENTYRAFIAAFAGEVRLIDNKQLN